jgi:hypothetical protein
LKARYESPPLARPRAALVDATGVLEAEVTNCIRETIDAGLSPGNQSVVDSLQLSASEFVARVTLNSSMVLQARARIGCDELAVRAEIIWRVI